MKSKKLIIAAMFIASAVRGGAQSLPYQNPNLTAEQRAEDLLKRLTLEEKTRLMMNGSPAIPRLGIPQFEWWNEALHGIGRNGFATVYPITTCMAASWDETLLEQVFTTVSDEARVKAQQAKRNGEIKRYQSLSFWTPNINIFRDPRWGRGQETYGEDPYLTEKMGIAVVRGLQGPDDAKYRKLLACAKHFAVHSGPEWNRHSFNIENLPARDLWETYLPAFKALVQKAGVAEVMCAYQRIDGEPCCGNTRYEQQILRDEWGFKGMIVSDCGAIGDFWQKGKHEVSKDAASASAKAVLSGTDVECGANYKRLPEAVKAGYVNEADIDICVKRLLKARFELGDFDADELVEWTKIPESIVACEAHKKLALDMARKGTVLLQNKNGLLPVDRKATEKIVVMGPNANDSVMMWGNYSGYPTRTITILQGIRRKAGNVKYIQGCQLTKNEVENSRYSMIKSPDGQKGMKATYWNNTNMEGEPVTTAYMREPINLSNGGATVFAPGVNLEKFSARYEGLFTPDQDETLTLSIGCDDKARVILDGDTVINRWKSRQRIDYQQVKRNFKAGKTYTIQIDYVQENDMAAIQFDLTKKTTPTKEQLLAETGDAETVIFVGGISPRLEGEEMKVDEPGFRGGDRVSIELPQVQRDLMAMLHEAGKKVIFVNCSGGAMGLVPESQHCDAIIQAWYGGEQGGDAVADIIFGDYNPSGKLPITFYKSADQLPDFEDYRMAGRTYRYFHGEPLFPFGHGLSYSTFSYGSPKYDIKNGILTIDITNTGTRDGEDVAQVYIRNTADPDGPIKTLREYKRVALKAGECGNVSIELPRERFEVWDTKTNTMRVVPGTYEIMVGNSSADNSLKKIKVKIK
ncbi:xylan 1,4-beta-xylosidase [Xylanibacter rodentium]|jgi:beta-glucosidase|uniref:Glycoside hydrolase family 3 protein n=4 Tax=Xylanibacter rodentium TaxID=2736289 RepID=A0ABX2AU30_9BACT|nr:xylan 1,4-beta-xylosidase [Xylanibacter rodentium]NPE11619.1 glycoside hydrolase family 3 protein [Prevotella sp. PJ1A]NPE13160.1 glycoside hydrolase family 3 protein [Xylanibacter rodentium]NPE38617.1 glycoside hydrolase family 3 protein [Prevotella sp. PCJ2]